MSISEHTTVYYFLTLSDAERVAQDNAASDPDWRYIVRFHAGRRAYFVSVYDEQNELLGYL